MCCIRGFFLSGYDQPDLPGFITECATSLVRFNFNRVTVLQGAFDGQLYRECGLRVARACLIDGIHNTADKNGVVIRHSVDQRAFVGLKAAGLCRPCQKKQSSEDQSSFIERVHLAMLSLGRAVACR